MSPYTANGRALIRLYRAGVPLAPFEFRLDNVSENALATRLPELAKHEGYVVGAYRPGKPYKEWALTEKGREAAVKILDNFNKTC